VAPTKETGFPVVILYGENDWMDVAGGIEAAQKLREERDRVLRTASEVERKREKGNAKVIIIKNAGHNLHLDGWEEFNQVMRREMEATLRQGRAGIIPRSVPCL
jgi:cardiolipin-specific phospholipase